MKTCFVKAPCSTDNIIFENRGDPAPGERQVLVRWHAASLNFHDYLVVSGAIPQTGEGVIPLSDAAGEVVALGPGVTRWAVGDKVMSTFFCDWVDGIANPAVTARVAGDSCDGYACELSAVDEHSITAIPETYSYVEAATLPCAGLTAWRSLFEDCNLQPGDKVLIEGSGGVSIFALQFAKAYGATVYATSSSDEKLQKMKALGADFLINYKKEANWGQKVFELSAGGVDHALDVGGTTLNQSIAACRTSGNVSSIGLLSGMAAEVDITQMLYKQIQIKSVMVGSRRMQEDMVQAINVRGIKPIVDTKFKLEEIAEAFQYQLDNKHFGKIGIEY